MSNTWADVNEALPDEAKPKDKDGMIVCDDAHAHIRCASLDYVRAWCKGKGESLSIADTTYGILITASMAIDLGSGPDEPSAWHAAVVYCKEHP